MTLKIETRCEGRTTVLRLIGQAETELLEELRAHIRCHARVQLELEEVTTVDISVVRFFVECEARGVVLVQCPLFIREWINREQTEQR